MSRRTVPVFAALACGAVLFAGIALAAPRARPAPAPEKKEAAPTPPERLITFDTCLRVVEGDQIEGKTVGIIRLLGIIAPGPDEPGYREAIDTTRRLVIGKPIKVEICPQRTNDYKDRLRAIVYLPDGTNLNTKLLRLGVARVLDHPPCHVDAKAWQVYEESARKAKLGLWAEAEEKPKAEKRTRESLSPRRSGGGVRIRPAR